MDMCKRLIASGIQVIPSVNLDGTLAYPPGTTPAQISAVVSALGGDNLHLLAAKDQAYSRVSQACQVAIESGITSSALGSAYTYPTDKVSQLNLSGEVSAAILSGPAGAYAFMCADGAGAWARRPHTDAQIKQVGLDVRAHVKLHLDHLDNLRGQIAAAQTAMDADAIVW